MIEALFEFVAFWFMMFRFQISFYSEWINAGMYSNFKFHHFTYYLYSSLFYYYLWFQWRHQLMTSSKSLANVHVRPGTRPLEMSVLRYEGGRKPKCCLLIRERWRSDLSIDIKYIFIRSRRTELWRHKDGPYCRLSRKQRHLAACAHIIPRWMYVYSIGHQPRTHDS